MKTILAIFGTLVVLLVNDGYFGHTHTCMETATLYFVLTICLRQYGEPSRRCRRPDDEFPEPGVYKLRRPRGDKGSCGVP